MQVIFSSCDSEDYEVDICVNFFLRVLHGFISSGLTETQYVSACKAAHIGNVDERYINTGITKSLK